MMFYGEPVDEMDRAKLLKVIAWLAERYTETQTPDAIRAQALGKVEMLRRGERA